MLENVCLSYRKPSIRHAQVYPYSSFLRDGLANVPDRLSFPFLEVQTCFRSVTFLRTHYTRGLVSDDQPGFLGQMSSEKNLFTYEGN